MAHGKLLSQGICRVAGRIGEVSAEGSRGARPADDGRDAICGEHLEVWQMCAKNWRKFRRNSLNFRSALKLCRIL